MKVLHYLVFLSFLPLLFSSCRTSSPRPNDKTIEQPTIPLPKDFKKFDILSSIQENRRVPTLDRLGINYTVTRHNHPEPDQGIPLGRKVLTKEEVNQKLLTYSWTIVLETISENQFNDLQKIFKTKPGSLIFNSKRKYKLSDFLPIAWQSLLGGSFVYKTRDNEKNSDYPIHHVTNCFSTVLGAIHSLFSKEGKFPKFYIMPSQFLGALSYLRISSKSWYGKKPDKDPKPSTYDIGVIEGNHGFSTSTEHAFIYLDEDWIFERVAPDENLPYRIAPRKVTLDQYDLFNPPYDYAVIEKARKISPKDLKKSLDYVKESVNEDIMTTGDGYFEFSSDIY